MRVSVTRNFVVYDSNDRVVRFAMSNKIGLVTGTDVNMMIIILQFNLHRSSVTQHKKKRFIKHACAFFSLKTTTT